MLSINQKEVMDEVAKQTAYIATHRDDGTAAIAYDRIATTKQDEELLCTYLQQAISLLTNALARYLVEGHTIPDDEGNYITQLDMPDNFDAHKANLKERAFQYVVDYVLSQWLTITDAKRSEQYANSAAAKLILCQVSTNFRKRPVRNE